MCTFAGASIVRQEACNDFLPAKNKHMKLRSLVDGLLLYRQRLSSLCSLPLHSRGGWEQGLGIPGATNLDSKGS